MPGLLQFLTLRLYLAIRPCGLSMGLVLRSDLASIPGCPVASTTGHPWSRHPSPDSHESGFNYQGDIFGCADFNNSGGISVQDIFDFLSAWFALDPRADFSGVNGITVQDIFDFLAAWFQGNNCHS